MLWTIPEDWDASQPAFIVGGGPSVPADIAGLLAGRRVIVVNSSYQTVPAADFCIFHDTRWWTPNKDRLRSFKGRVVSFAGAPGGERVLRIRRMDCAAGLSWERDALVMGRTTLQPAINLAVLLGARQLVLIGIDMGPAQDGRTHHHEPHPWPQRPNCWDEQMQYLRFIVDPLKKAGVAVLNASPVSRLPWWPKVPLQDCL